jgi:hypothetical protein
MPTNDRIVAGAQNQSCPDHAWSAPRLRRLTASEAELTPTAAADSEVLS